MRSVTILRTLALLALLAAPAVRAALPVVPLDAPPDLVRIAVTGDIGEGSDRVARGIASLHASARLDAIVIAGDNIYPCGVRSPADPQWSRVTPLAALQLPLFAALGNHDHCGNADAQVVATGVVPYWTMPAREYAITHPLASFVVIDSTPVSRGNAAGALASIATFARDGRWHIVVSHHPPYSSGYHGYFPRDEHRRMVALMPALHTAGVDLVLAGHDHHEELLATKPAILVSGAGSEPVPPVLLHRVTQWPTEVSRERISFAVLEITARTLRTRFYDERGRAVSPWIVVAKR